MRRLATLGLIIAAAALTARGQLVITTSPMLPPAIIGQPYPAIGLQAANGSGNLTWSFVESGPPGFLALSAPAGDPNQIGSFCFGSGSCSGAPVTGVPNVYMFSIEVTSQFSQTAFQEFTLIVENPLQIVTTFLPTASASQSYSATLQGTGGTGNYLWSILNDGGSLPPGISLVDPVKGVLAGTAPGLNGVYTFTVQLVDQTTQETVKQQLSITVVGGVPATTILTTSLPNATVSQPYVFQFLGTGLNPVWSVVPSTQLPPGFSLGPDGLLTGISGSTGAFSFQIQLINSFTPTQNAQQTYSFFITLGPLSIVEGTLPAAALNVPYSTTLTPSLGLPPYTWSLGAGTPAGLSISSSGVISGTLTTAGSFPVLVSLKDATGTIFTRNYTLVVSNKVSITTTSLPNGGLNVPYSATLTAIAGQPPDTWSISGGSLPPGLTLSASNGQISGTPTTLGSYPFTVKVTDSASSSTKDFTIVISTPLTITTTLIGASLGQNYTLPNGTPVTLTATGGTQPVISWNLSSGNLPTGLFLNSSTGAITGIPSVLGPATFTVQALDSARGTATQSFTLTVAPPVTISAADFTTPVGAAVSQTVTAGGGVPPYTFTIVSAAPGGLQLGASTGVISGAANTTGAFPVTLRATDANGRFANATITITVNSLPLTIVVPASPGSGQQPGIGVSTSAPATGDITGTLTLAFAPSAAGGTDNMIVFQNGSRSITFTIPKGSTTAPNVTVITGTVAGTITLTASVPGNADVIKTIIIAPTVPVISSVALQQVTGGLNVVVSGYSNTREVSSGSFTFTVSSGNTLSQAAITVPLTSAYATWFGNTTSNATGGQFKLTVPFSVTQGSASAITKVSVTLTNGQGTSAAVSSQ